MKVRRLPVVDEYRDGDQVAVLVGGRLLVLSVAATAALRAIGQGWAEVGHVSGEVVRLVGPPPEADAETAVTAVLRELAVIDLVELQA